MDNEQPRELSSIPSSSYDYQVGGALPNDALTYVRRQADEDLCQALQEGQFCYVLNSRQMGKSSLRVQATQKFLAQGIHCALIDITSIGTTGITPEQWYAGAIDTLLGCFNLYKDFDLETWWFENSLLSPVQKLNKFIDTVLLKLIETKIIIFIDEIDSILSLPFNIDDFFAVIRDCYNRRANNPSYSRLSFVILGVCTPSDLIQDKQRTPFNIGRAINLTGFKLHEVEPLAKGLVVTGNPQEAIQTVLDWTGGQPFLTQKVCQILVKSSFQSPIAERVAQLVRERIVENWEMQDEPEHLRTIRNRLLHSGEKRTGKLLGLCQEILEKGEILADDSPEQAELRLTGLVVKQDGKLRIYNRIYEQVFNLKWCEQELTKLRPYAEALNAWIASTHQDKSRLLRGQALQDARDWSVGKSLSDLDYQFLSKSQEANNEDREKRLAIEAAKESIEQARRITGIALASLICITGIAIFAAIQWKSAERGQIQALATSATAKFIINRSSFDSLIDALKAGQQLERSIWYRNDPHLRIQVMEALSNAIYWVKESNRLEKHQSYVQSVRFSPNGRMMATASYDGTAKLWNVNGKEIITLKGHKDAVVDVSFSPDSQTIATSSRDGTTKLWNLEGKLLLNLQQGANDTIWGVSFSPNGQIIATCGEDRTVKLWNLKGNLLKTWKAHSLAIRSISFSPKGDKIATASYDNKVNFWDTQGKLIHSFEGHLNSVTRVSFSPDGQTLASTSSDATVILWDVTKKTKRATLQGHTNRVNDVAFSPDGQTIVTGSRDETVRLWLNRNGQPLAILEGHKGLVNSVSFNPQEKMFASAGNDKTVKVWKLSDRLRTLIGHNAPIYTVDVNPKGDVIATAGQDGLIKLWNLQAQEIKTLKGHKQSIGLISFSPDGNAIASASSDKTVKRWNLHGNELKPSLVGHQEVVTSIKYSPDGKTIVSASRDKTIKFWDLSGKLLKTFKRHNAAIYDVTFSPDGTILVSVSEDGTVQIWNRNGNPLKIWQAHNAPIYRVSVSPDNQTIATSSEDNTVKLWNRNSHLLKTLTGHTAGVWGISFSPDDQLIATGSDDNTAKIWTRNGLLLTTLSGHQKPVNSLKFSSDSKQLVTASSDKTVLLWNIEDLNINKLVKRGCNWLKDYQQHDQRSVFDTCDR